ncbi:hypothetical protein OPQ81_003834 [Rhizoctonia solani]|nr:hypothetical protein OPQ81_003834 [Rhizoctonia solani]
MLPWQKNDAELCDQGPLFWWGVGYEQSSHHCWRRGTRPTLYLIFKMVGAFVEFALVPIHVFHLGLWWFRHQLHFCKLGSLLHPLQNNT